MGGVDIAELRSNYSVQQKSLRNWLPLFYLLLDIAVINSYRLHQQHHPNTTHKKFREDIIRSWIQSTILIGPTPTPRSPSVRFIASQSIFLILLPFASLNLMKKSGSQRQTRCGIGSTDIHKKCLVPNPGLGTVPNPTSELVLCAPNARSTSVLVRLLSVAS